MNQNATIPVAAARSDSLRGIACLVLGTAVFAMPDVVIKMISGVYPLHEAMVLRSIAAFPVLLLPGVARRRFRNLDGARMALAADPRHCRPSWPIIAAIIWGWPRCRSPPFVALYFAAPLFITVLSVLFLGERVGPRRWAAVVMEPFGVVTILRPAPRSSTGPPSCRSPRPCSMRSPWS